MADINATGFGLTFGVHSRIDETIGQLAALSAAGNVYVNRNMIGAVVGVQPFGGHGLSGTGPKAGGPLYLRRLSSCGAEGVALHEEELPGPVGELNSYALQPRGRVLCIAATAAERERQLALARSLGNAALDSGTPESCDAILFDGSPDALLELQRKVAALEGPIRPILTPPYAAAMLVLERSTSVNTAAAGGNARLMSLG